MSNRRVRRPCDGPALRHERRGFGLIEILVTVAIIGIIALIAVAQLSRTFQRAAVEGAADNARAVMQRAATDMKMRGRPTFVEVAQAAGRWELRLWEDTNENGALNAAPTDTLRQTYVFPPGIALSTANTAQIQTTNWSVNSADSVARYIGCDNLSRAFTPGTPQIQGPAVLTLTHELMLPLNNPKLAPTVRYELRVNPVWSVAVQRSRYNTSTSTWTKL